MLPTSEHVRRQRTIDIACAQDEDEREQAGRRAEDDNIIDAALAALLLHAISQDLDAREEAAREARRLHFHVFNAPKKQCVRRDIQTPEFAPWNYFEKNNNGSDQSWFHCLGLSKNSFESLVGLCQEPWSSNPIIDFNGMSRPQGKPRPSALATRLLDCRATMALSLRYLTTTDSRDALAKMFGVVESCVNKYISFAISIVLHVLGKNEHSMIYWPLNDVNYLDAMAKKVHCYEKDLQNIFGIKIVGFLDGIRFCIVNKSGGDYSGEKKKVLRKMILLFDANGRVVAAVINCPGSWNDGKCTRVGHLYSLIEQLLGDYSIVADTAFRGSLLNGNIKRILKHGERIPPVLTNEGHRQLEKLLTRVRQPAEWGNNALVQAFKRLRQRLGGNDELNGELMRATILLHNWRVSTCNRNQIKSFFQQLQLDEGGATDDEDNLLIVERGLDLIM